MKNKQAILIAFAAVMLLSMGLFGCHRQKLPQHQFILAKTSFKNLSGWEKDDQKQALDVLQKSCAVIAKQNPNQQFGKLILQGGKVEGWQKICTAIDKVEANDSSSARKFFESWFEPYRVYDDSSTQGLFTGYYLPLLNCSLKQNKHYSTPVHAIPDDWVKADLSLFDKKLKGKTIVGQVKGHALRPYPTRASIVRGAIPKSSKVLVWCDDKVNVAFAHIQGSAIVRLPDGKKFLIGYEGANGRPYTSI
ncbi:MAG: MltA domain-containing protein, partial [Gammaproteobacteria bacterium]|nr:MltA domain-containing protein [Gammaproteobacteria bacterium]